jgi:hypothetical protein
MDWNGWWRACHLIVKVALFIPLYVSPSQLKFGKVYVSDSLNLKLKIKNGSVPNNKLKWG